jgi:hypothetical protein
MPNRLKVPEIYKFDAGWPKTLPNNWITGSVTDMSEGNVYVSEIGRTACAEFLVYDWKDSISFR